MQVHHLLLHALLQQPLQQAAPAWGLLFVAVVLAAVTSLAVKDESADDDLADGKTFRVTT